MIYFAFSDEQLKNHFDKKVKEEAKKCTQLAITNFRSFVNGDSKVNNPQHYSWKGQKEYYGGLPKDWYDFRKLLSLYNEYKVVVKRVKEYLENKSKICPCCEQEVSKVFIPYKIHIFCSYTCKETWLEQVRKEIRY